MSKQPEDLLTKITSATPADVEEIDRRLRTVAKDLTDYQEAKSNELRGLLTLRKILAPIAQVTSKPPVRADGTPFHDKPRKQRSDKKGATAAPPTTPLGDTAKDRIALLLFQHGPMRPPEIEQRLGIMSGTIYAATKDCNWFDRQSNGIHLTPTGHQAIKASPAGGKAA